MRGRHIEKLNASERLEKAHVSLMRDKRTALFSGVMLMGDSKIVDDCPTAKTLACRARYPGSTPGRGVLPLMHIDENRLNLSDLDLVVEFSIDSVCDGRSF